jgi:hypothetical protein
VWFGGGKLAPDLSLPKLRQRWPEPGGRACRKAAGPGGSQAWPRLHGRGMASGPGRAVLRRELAAAAAAARSEPEFFAGLERAGLMVRTRYADAQPGAIVGYAVSLPGMTHHQEGTQVWYGGATLDSGLGLETLRRRWRAGRAGAPRAAANFTDTEAADVFGHAAETAAWAARQLRSGPGSDEAADIAWAAADVLYAAADTTGSAELRRAADGFSRAARAPWGRIPAPSSAGSGLRTTAYLLAACEPAGAPRTMVRLALISALTGLARAVAELREAQGLLLQTTAAHSAAADLSLAAADDAVAKAPVALTTVDFAGQPVMVRRTGALAARRVPGPRPVSGPQRARRRG